MKFILLPLKRIYLFIEAWFNASNGPDWNPLYHLGSLAIYLFWIVLVSGIYLFLFFDTGLESSYASVEYLTHEQWYLGGVMRSMHRYASDAAIGTIILHVFREFSLDRYRGIRWYSWFTGIPNLWMIVLLGITGYWLVWDQLAQYVAIGSSKLLDALPIFTLSMSRTFLDGSVTDRFFTLMGFLHLLGQPMFLIFGLWFHVRRLADVQVVVPRGLAIGSFVALLALSLIKPVTSHPPADLSLVPPVLNLDWFYLNVYPLLNVMSGGQIWFLVLGITFLLMMAPWLPRRSDGEVAEVDLENCNGCGQCSADCPFDAISMQARTDGARWEFEPVVLPHLCAACGICMGACHSSNPFRKTKTDDRLMTGIDMPQLPLHDIRNSADAALEGMSGETKIMIFGCSNGYDITQLKADDVAPVKLICAGMLPPALVDYALKKGADGVMVSGCREGDCYYRHGNQWMDHRFNHNRRPALRARVDRQKVTIQGGAETDGKKLARALEELRSGLKDRAISGEGASAAAGDVQEVKDA